MFLIIIGIIFLPLQTVQAAQRANTSTANVFKYIFDRSEGKLKRFPTKEQLSIQLLNLRKNQLLTAVLEEETEENIAHIRGRIKLKDLLFAQNAENHIISINPEEDRIRIKTLVNVTDEHGKTPLILASAHGRLEFVKMLLSAGANVFKRTKQNQTALDFARDNGHEEIVQILKHEESAVRRSQQPGVTALALAVQQGNMAIVNMLLGHDDYIDAQSSGYHRFG